MARSKSSHRWLKEHFDDPYVKQAQKEGWRSRAVYKLSELDQKERLLHQGQTVLDLGAAPGGWSQWAIDRVGEGGKVVASDILAIDPLPFVHFIQGDFREERVLNEILAVLEGMQADLVMSDMAPNFSGMGAIDQPKAMYLCELALDLAQQTLRQGGNFVVKLFQGEGSDDFIKAVRQSFKAVNVRKPQASRPRSREVYLVARNFIG